MFKFFAQKERKILGGMGLILFALILFHFFIALGEKRAYLHSRELLEVKKNKLQKMEKEKIQLEKEWDRWVQARQDMKELKENYLYTSEGGVEILRKDLQKIFRGSSVQISPLRYDYPKSEEKNIQRIQVSFDASGSYFSLKKFIHDIEIFPKFLVIEKIDFLNINPESGILKLNLVVSGYYEE